jgi:penicillin-binding protein 1C
VVVLDNKTGDVLAYVGGIGGASTAPRGRRRRCAYRQAGSTLKPFLYAQAIEKGYLTAASILEDSPVQLDTASGLYVPQNYDAASRGRSRSARAGNSLNVPAVRTLAARRRRLSRPALGHRLSWADRGRPILRLSLALGSAEVTLLEQANAYRSLANGGRWSPLRLNESDPSGRAAPR